MARPFYEVLAEVDGGLLIERISEKLAAVSVAVGDVQKPGELTIKLSIKPNGAGKFFIDSKVEGKAPDHPIETALFYGDINGNLTRTNPEQEKLNIRKVVG
jgi:hypothetical protein